MIASDTDLKDESRMIEVGVRSARPSKPGGRWGQRRRVGLVFLLSAERLVGLADRVSHPRAALGFLGTV